LRLRVECTLFCNFQSHIFVQSIYSTDWVRDIAWQITVIDMSLFLVILLEICLIYLFSYAF
jgi:hypothetical protein